MLLLYLLAGIGVNITSLNLVFTDVVEINSILPFIIAYPVSTFWTILCLILPINNKNFFARFAEMPIATYDWPVSDGNSKPTVHPFTKPFLPDNSFFENTALILIILVCAASEFDSTSFMNVKGTFLFTTAVAQLIFWMYSISLFVYLKKEQV